jgi:hypothetical protein
VLPAAADAAGAGHGRAVILLEGSPRPPGHHRVGHRGCGWLIEGQLGTAAEARFYRSIAAGDIDVLTLTAGNWEWVAELVGR